MGEERARIKGKRRTRNKLKRPQDRIRPVLRSILTMRRVWPPRIDYSTHHDIPITQYLAITQRKFREKDTAMDVRLTFTINNSQPIRRDPKVSQHIHGGNVRQRRHGEELARREGLYADLMFVFKVQDTRDDRRDTVAWGSGLWSNQSECRNTQPSIHPHRCREDVSVFGLHVG